MHLEIRHSLEDYLKGSARELPAEFHSHLGECEECANELRSLEEQSQLLRALRSPRDVEPRAGFYARVLERIEAQPASIWSVFLDRKFGLRLAVASAALVALLGTYLVTSEPSGPELASTPTVVLTDTLRTTESDGLQQKQQRDAVLVDLASYHQ
jgi:predicted anti-sigma-YlaC factor YlaD